MKPVKPKFGIHRASKEANERGLQLPRMCVNGEMKRVHRLWKVEPSTMRARERHNVTQDDVRLKRIQDRAKGVKFALGHGDLNNRKRKEMEQILRNLELAATAINRELKKR